MLKALLRNRDGTALIEFGLSAPVVLTLIGGMFEVTRILFVSALLEWSMSDASRFGITGQEGSEEISREELISNIVENRTLGMVNMDEATLETLIYPSFETIGASEEFVDGNGNGLFDEGEDFDDTNGNGQWDEDMGLEGSGGADDVVLYRVTYDLPTMIPFMEPLFGAITLVSTAAVRNEPF